MIMTMIIILQNKRQHVTVLVNLKYGVSQVVRGKVNVVSYISSFDVNDESDVGNTDFKWWFSFATFLIELEFEDADF